MESILSASRVKIGEIATEDKGQRRRQIEGLRAEARTRIIEVLTPEQRPRYEAMTGAGRARTGTVAGGRVWMPDAAGGPPKMVPVRVGLTDGTHTELVSGDLSEGAELIVGVGADATKARAQPQSKSGPRFGF